MHLWEQVFFSQTRDPRGAKDSWKKNMNDKLNAWEIVNFKPYQRNSLQGFFDLKIDPGLVIKGLAYHINNGKPWVSFPASAKADKTGNILRDPYGKIEWFNIVHIPNREFLNDFQVWAAAQLRQLIEAGGGR